MQGTAFVTQLMQDGWGWSEGGKLFAWFGCLFWLIVWVVMVVTGGIAAFLGMLF